MENVEWFAANWGPTNLRVWGIGSDGNVIAELTSDRGAQTLRREEFGPVLVSLIEPYLSKGAIPVVCCGRVGAGQGSAEAEYPSVPCTPPEASLAAKIGETDARISVHIVPGVKQVSPADVMQGEETQIAGFLADNPKFFGTVCMPGAYTKWVQISAGEIVSFRTFITGEMVDLLAEQSVLKNSVTGDGWSDDAFLDAVNDALGSPQQVASRLFGIHAEGLLSGQGQAEAKAQMAGLLIGMELAGARGYWLGQELVLIGSPALNKLYGDALGHQGVVCRAIGGDDMTLAGLKSVYKTLGLDQT